MTDNNNSSQWISKYQQIEECLRGSDDNDGRIDLWQLRELSLSYGGLLDPKLRKRAWPILAQVMTRNTTTSSNVTLSSPSTSSAPQHKAISSKDIVQIQNDVKHTVWNVKAHFRSQQQMNNAATNGKNRRVNFPDVNNDDDANKTEDGDPSTSHSNDDGLCTEHSNPKNSQYNDIETTMSSSFADGTTSRRSKSSKQQLHNTKASKHEQRTVTNVIVSCLRTIPPEWPSEKKNDDSIHIDNNNRFHYYTGFHDLTALIMVNVESLSITSLLLGTLSMYHLRDAFRSDRMVLDTAMKLTFFPLLKSIDEDLFRHLIGQGVEDIKKLLSFVIYGISNWFATDTMDIAAASRLIDAFLVSHPTTPVYYVIAILINYRDCIMSSSDMNDTVRRLPLFSDRSEMTTSTSLAIVEQLISMTLKYMELSRPCALMELNESVVIWSDTVRQQLLSNVGAVAMLSATPPAWCIADVSPNEWTIIQNVIHPGEINCDTFVMNSYPGPCTEKYPLAIAALGCEIHAKISEVPNEHSPSIRKRLVVVAVLTVLTMALIQYGMIASSVNTPAGDSHEYVEKVSLILPDSATSCIECHLVESTVDGYDTHDTSVHGKVEPLSNINMTLCEPLLDDSHQTYEENVMMVPSASSLVNDVFQNNDSQDITEASENSTVEHESVMSLPSIVDATDNDFTDSTSDIELAFEQNILQPIHYRNLKVERRIQSLISSPTIAQSRRLIASQVKKVIDNIHVPVSRRISLVQGSVAMKRLGENMLMYGNLLKHWFQIIKVNITGRS